MRRFIRRYWLALAIPAAFVAAWALLWGVHEWRLSLAIQDIRPGARLIPAPSRFWGMERHRLKEEVEGIS